MGDNLKIEMSMKRTRNKLRVARVSTISFFIATQLKKQVKDISDAGFEVILVSGRDKGMDVILDLGLEHEAINIPRNISIIQDVIALFKLYRFFRERKIDIIHSTTPKAGLLCAIAGLAARVNVRLHTFTGQAWANKSGLVRWISKFCDKVIISLNTQVYADSFSQIDYLTSQNIVKNRKEISVLGDGSLAGVDLDKFNRDKFSQGRDLEKIKLGIPENGQVILFLGRLAVDKGLMELLIAFNSYSRINDNVFLLLVGPLEINENEALKHLFEESKNNPRILQFDFTSEPEKYLSVCDFICLPSYREGFGTSIIEAGAMGIPAIGTDVQGLRDSIVDGETGILVPSRDAIKLEKAINTFLSNPDLIKKMGENAYTRVLEKFSSTRMNNYVINEYLKHSM